MPAKKKLTAKVEPFDTFWEAPEDIEKGYTSFYQFYKKNYLEYVPKYKNASILVVSCGPGYFVNLLKKEGYTEILGIDSDSEKVKYAKDRGLNCIAADAFAFLGKNEKSYDAIFAEQEINHLTKEEILEFLRFCHNNLREGGTLIVHSLNGANPITGSEALAQNYDHYNTFTEYSLRQVLELSNFDEIRVIPLKLFVFYNNPLNYVGMILDKLMTL
ncbi:MAG: methyltransferase domain-containing protein, partial [candidate division Zixibacteria bacterium]|nr:methyltransferase domain-containing protein [candidate division Zixibacteria bacterium]